MIQDIESKELQEMKAQLAILTKKLERETIVNERAMRQVMREKANGLRQNSIITIIIAIFAIPLYLWVIPELLGISMSFCVFTVIFLIFAIAYDYYIYSHFHPERFVHGNLIEAKRDTLMLKKMYKCWIKYVGIPFIIIFIVWFGYEISHSLHGILLKGAIIGGCIGGIIGGMIGYHFYLKTQRTADNILQQIKELTEE